MTVTRIEPLSGSRVRVFLEGEFAFVLYKGELRLYGIREGEPLSGEAWEEIRETVLKKRSRLRCMNLLKERPYTEYQLKTKLLQGGYPEEVAADALDYVKAYGYIDDGRYAIEYVANQQAKKSRRRIEEDLLRRGVPKELIRAAFFHQEQLGEGPDELAQARQWMEKKHFDPQRADYGERQKMAAFLYRKGICMEAIRQALAGGEGEW